MRNVREQVCLPRNSVDVHVVVFHWRHYHSGVQVSVYYVGTLAKNNKRFDSCQKGKPFRFRLGRGEVIKGWDTGLIGELTNCLVTQC